MFAGRKDGLRRLEDAYGTGAFQMAAVYGHATRWAHRHTAIRYHGALMASLQGNEVFVLGDRRCDGIHQHSHGVLHPGERLFGQEHVGVGTGRGQSTSGRKTWEGVAFAIALPMPAGAIDHRSDSCRTAPSMEVVPTEIAGTPAGMCCRCHSSNSGPHPRTTSSAGSSELRSPFAANLPSRGHTMPHDSR